MVGLEQICGNHDRGSALAFSMSSVAKELVPLGVHESAELNNFSLIPSNFSKLNAE